MYEDDRMSNKKIYVTNVQRFSLHDGPGIRTTVFLKGCSLRCPWCSNPENLIYEPQKYIKDGIYGIYGRQYEIEELYSEIVKDINFYDGKKVSYVELYNAPLLLNELPGGVTFSGGECLLYMSNLKELLNKLKSRDIHIAVETSLFVPQEQLLTAISYVDLFYVDVKILIEKCCRNILKGNLEVYLSNLDVLFNHHKPVVIRIPVISGYTDDTENRTNILTLLNKYKNKILKVELIKEHNLAISKYQSLIDAGNSIEMPKYSGESDKMMEQYKCDIVNKVGIWTEICRI